MNKHVKKYCNNNEKKSFDVKCLLSLPPVTRSKAVDLQKKQTSRSVFQCYVFGAPGVGKVLTISS